MGGYAVGLHVVWSPLFGQRPAHTLRKNEVIFQSNELLLLHACIACQMPFWSWLRGLPCKRGNGGPGPCYAPQPSRPPASHRLRAYRLASCSAVPVRDIDGERRDRVVAAIKEEAHRIAEQTKASLHAMYAVAQLSRGWLLRHARPLAGACERRCSSPLLAFKPHLPAPTSEHFTPHLTPPRPASLHPTPAPGPPLNPPPPCDFPFYFLQTRVSFEVINQDPPATCGGEVVAAGEAAAAQLGLSTKHMVSRAYHDALFMAQVGGLRGPGGLVALVGVFK